MNEMPVWFDIAGNFTINSKSKKTVHICATDNEKNQFTVILTCVAGKDFLKITFFHFLQNSSILQITIQIYLPVFLIYYYRRN